MALQLRFRSGLAIYAKLGKTQSGLEKNSMLFILALFLYALVAVAWYRIFRRLGWHSLLGLTMILPFAVFVVSTVMYFQRWPLERKVEELEQEIERLKVQIT